MNTASGPHATPRPQHFNSRRSYRRWLRKQQLKNSRQPRISNLEPLEPRLLMSGATQFELSSLLPTNGGDGAAGFVISGVEAYEWSGDAVSNAGDLNGDGYDDLLIGPDNGISSSTHPSDHSGKCIVVFSNPTGNPPLVDSALLDGKNGFVFYGNDVWQWVGSSVSSAGDINGDGIDDLVIGAESVDSNGIGNSGECYVIYGSTSGFPAAMDRTDLDGTNGFVIQGESLNGDLGRYANSAGDVNGDGINDIIVGGRYRSYVIFGQDAGFNASINVQDLDGTDGFEFYTPGSIFHSNGSGGDFNGDGLADIAIGATSFSSSAADAAYVIYGKASGFAASLTPADLDGTNGFAISGFTGGSAVQPQVNLSSDFNGDGINDLLLGHMQSRSMPNDWTGLGYVVFGTAAGFNAELGLADLDGVNGFTIIGANTSDRLGQEVAGAGDFNGDGIDDLMIAAPTASPNGHGRRGEVYIVLGRTGPFTAGVGVKDFVADAGIVINGWSYGTARSISFAGDVNGDGYDDVIIGDTSVYVPGRNNAGGAYVVYGYDVNNAVTQGGTAGDDVLTGTTAVDVLVGGAGKDELIGLGGADSLRGGQGDDILAVSDLGFVRIVGGNGYDTLRLDASGLALDLTAIPDNRILGIEAINISGTGANSLTLGFLDVLNLSDESNTLTVLRDSNDSVDMGPGWVLMGAEAIGETTYDVYAQGAATLRIAQDATETLPGDLNRDGFVGIVDLNIVLGNWNQTAPVGNPLADANGDGFVGIEDLNAVLGNWAAGASRTIDIADLRLANGGDGTAGFIIKAANHWDYTGQSVSSAGDINGDGFDDVIVGAPGGYFAYGDRPGQSYVVFGKAGGFPAELEPATLDGTNGFVIRGINNGDYAGRSVSGAGDINGDGLDDLIVGSPGSWFSPSDKSGDSYVIFGKTSGFTADLDLAAIDGTNGFAIRGINAKDRAGTSVSGAGDINGDGFDDMIIGVWREYPSGAARNAAPGESYVVFGKAGGFGADVDLAALDGTNGFLINGTNTGDYAGGSVSGAGDVNGDGFDDLIVGAARGFLDPGLTAPYGGSFVVFGKANGFAATLELSDLDGVSGFAIRGVNIGDFTGFSVSGAGDVNGDGFDDLTVGAMEARPNNLYRAGASYVIFGHGGGYAADVDLASLDGDNGFTVYGTSSYLDLGTSVSGAGDLNADGYDDLIFGASGHSYVIFGSPGGFAAHADLSSLNGINGFTISSSGSSVSSAGDVNGDGFDDLIIGASYSNVGYVIFGGNFTGAVSQNGTNTDNTLIGSAAADVLVGGQANDTLVGNGGADVLRGGEGDDTLAVSDFNFIRLAGGNGLDTLRLDMPGVAVNLTTLTGNRVTGIDAIDLADSDPDTLTLRAADVLSFSDESNTLAVIGDASDTVIVDAGWTFSGTEVIGSNIVNVYAQGAATLKIAQPVMIPPVTGIDTLATSDTTPNLTGVAQLLVPGGATIDTIHVTVAGTTYTATDNGDGTWSLPGSKFSSALPDGVYDVVVTVTDTQGNIGTDTTHDELVIDTIDPVVTVDTLSTIDHAPQLTGTIADADLNATILVTVAGTTYTATNNGDGTWVLADNKIAPHLPLGAYDVAVTAIDAAGNVGSDTTTNELTVRFGIVRLADLLPANGGDGTAGFVIGGTGAGGNFGVSVSNAGDVNGDGFDDMIIKAGSAGRGYVVFGRTNGFDDFFDLSTLDGTNGFVIYGARSSIGAAGDVNGDGFDDVIIGDSSASPNGERSAGKSYVVFGKANGFEASFNVSSLNGTNGFAINGIDHFDDSGFSVSSVGDVNGDGFGDLAIGAPNANFSLFISDPFGEGDGASRGESYVVFGKAGGFDAEIDLINLDGSNGFIILAKQYVSRFGAAVNGAGDINGDGFDDLIVGAPNANDLWDYHYPRHVGTGESYVIFGKAGGFDRHVSIRSLDGSDGFVITGSDRDDHAGHSVASAGDINDDGFDDLIVGTDSVRDADGKPRAGEAYIIFGKVDGYAAAINLSTLDGTNGFVVTGTEQDFLGRSVSGAGDVNGDGYDDLIIGAYSADPYGQSAAGESYVIFGRPGGYPAEIMAADLDGTNGFIIRGALKGDHSGYSVSRAGDINGDGFDDLIIGAPGWSQPDADGSGGSFVIFGGDFSAAVTQNGTTGADALVGSVAVDVLIGGQDDDGLVGNGGPDVLRGGEGDDVLAISDPGFARIVGGNGHDTLRIDAAGLTLDLTNIPDNRITGIEAIDLAGSGANSLKLNLLEVLNLSDESNTLTLRSDADDSVSLGSGWALTNSEAIGPDMFNVYEQGVATLKITRVTSVAGDLNGDGFVGNHDLNAVLTHWNMNVTPGDLALGDPTGDGFVGNGDLNLVLGNWNAGSPPTATAITASSSERGLPAAASATKESSAMLTTPRSARPQRGYTRNETKFNLRPTSDTLHTDNRPAIAAWHRAQHADGIRDADYLPWSLRQQDEPVGLGLWEA